MTPPRCRFEKVKLVDSPPCLGAAEYEVLAGEHLIDVRCAACFEAIDPSAWETLTWRRVA